MVQHTQLQCLALAVGCNTTMLFTGDIISQAAAAAADSGASATPNQA
jgi:hypothetical protein